MLTAVVKVPGDKTITAHCDSLSRKHPAPKLTGYFRSGVETQKSFGQFGRSIVRNLRQITRKTASVSDSLRRTTRSSVIDELAALYGLGVAPERRASRW
jgi:hypothetical protein